MAKAETFSFSNGEVEVRTRGVCLNTFLQFVEAARKPVTIKPDAGISINNFPETPLTPAQQKAISKIIKRRRQQLTTIKQPASEPAQAPALRSSEEPAPMAVRRRKVRAEKQVPDRKEAQEEGAESGTPSREKVAHRIPGKPTHHPVMKGKHYGRPFTTFETDEEIVKIIKESGPCRIKDVQAALTEKTGKKKALSTLWFRFKALEETGRIARDGKGKAPTYSVVVPGKHSRIAGEAGTTATFDDAEDLRLFMEKRAGASYADVVALFGGDERRAAGALGEAWRGDWLKYRQENNQRVYYALARAAGKYEVMR